MTAPSNLPPFAPGDVIADKYRVERLLGSGGMAWVFAATHLLLQQRVALKFLRLEPSADNTEAIALVRREGRAAASISGEATARVMDVGTLDDGSQFLVMECLEGRDLDSVVTGQSPLPIETAVNYAIQACEGLAETHAAGIVHRDLKPSNLFLTHTSDGSVRVKLIDFGVSEFAEPSSDPFPVARTPGFVGSPVYMSPEQMRSSSCIDSRTDIWSMGVILYELLAQGESPFSAPTLPEIRARVLDEKPLPLGPLRRDVPRALEAVVLRCLEKDPSRRFQTVADLASALVPFGPPDARPRAERIGRILNNARGMGSGPMTLDRRQPGRRSLYVAGGVAALVVLALTAAIVLRPHDVVTTEVSTTSVPTRSAPASPEVPLTVTAEPVAPPQSLGPAPPETAASRPSSRTARGRAAPPPPAPATARAVKIESKLTIPRSGSDVAEFGGRR